MPVMGSARARTVERETRGSARFASSALQHGEGARDSSCRRRAWPGKPGAIDQAHAQPARASTSAATLPAGPAPTTRTSSGVHHRPPQHQRAVLRPEAETVAERRVDRPARAVFGMKSMSQAGSGSSRLIVGGRTPRCMRQRRGRPRRRHRSRPADVRSSTWSTNPGPRRRARRTPAARSATRSASFNCVDVPW